MKKLLFIASLFCSILFFSACSNEETDQIQANSDPVSLSIIERFAICKEVAVYHSKGLEFAYNKIKSSTDEKTLPALRNVTRQGKMELINGIVTDFISNEPIRTNLLKYDCNINLNNRNAINTQNSILRSGDSQDVPRIFTFFDHIVDVDKATNTASIQSLIESAINSEEFESFSEEEQNELLLMFAIFEDSSNYWTAHLNRWNNLVNRKNDNTTLLRSGETVLADDIDIINDASIWKADAIGAIAGGVGGAIGGAIAGAFAGGVGAGPGAIAGGVGGAVSCAIASSLTVWLSGGDIAATNPSTPEIINFLQQYQLH